MMCIKGGYILQPRVIDNSEFMRQPPLSRELWHYLLRNVNHKSNEKYARGSGFFNLEKISEDLHWYVGFRKMKYSKSAISKALSRFCKSTDKHNTESDTKATMMATMKATRGIIITICNFDYYQDPKNYEGNDEGSMKGSTKGHTKNKKDKNDKKVIDITSITNSNWKTDFSIYKEECRLAFIRFQSDENFIANQEYFFPIVNIQKTMESSFDTYWKTEKAWDYKRKQKIEKIDWMATIKNVIKNPKNRIYYSKAEQVEIDSKREKLKRKKEAVLF